MRSIPSGGGDPVRQVPEVRDSPKNPLRNERCVTDTFSWVVPLDTTGIAKPDTPDHVIELSSWQWYSFSTARETWPQQSQCDGAQLSSKVFRHQYLCSERCAKFLIEQIHSLQHTERTGPIPKDANSGWRARHSPHVLPRPAGYNYWDDYFPKFYRLYLEKGEVQIKLQRQWDVDG